MAMELGCLYMYKDAPFIVKDVLILKLETSMAEKNEPLKRKKKLLI
jgi:hypothetical protein